MNCITFTKTNLPYGWMGNMSNYSIPYEKWEFPRAEHFFIWRRLEDPTGAIADVICTMKNPMAIKRYSKKMLKEGIWKLKYKLQSKEDIESMVLTIRLKLTYHKELAEQLVDTGSLHIYEDVTNRASVKTSSLFWGAVYICNDLENTESMWVGNNQLGKILMIARNSIQEMMKLADTTNVQFAVSQLWKHSWKEK